MALFSNGRAPPWTGLRKPIRSEDIAKEEQNGQAAFPTQHADHVTGSHAIRGLRRTRVEGSPGPPWRTDFPFVKRPLEALEEVVAGPERDACHDAVEHALQLEAVRVSGGARVREHGERVAVVAAHEEADGAGHRAVVPVVRVRDDPPEAVALVRVRAAEHRVLGGGVEDVHLLREAIRAHHEPQEVDGGRDPAAVRVHAADLHVVGSAAVVHDLTRLPLREGVAPDPHAAHAALLQHDVPQVVLVRLASHLLDDTAEDAVPEVRVLVHRTGLILDAAVVEDPPDEGCVVHVVVHEHGVSAVVREAARVLQKVAHDDALHLVAVWLDAVHGAEDGAAPEHLPVELELAVLDEIHDGDGRDGFGDARDAEEVARVHLLAHGRVRMPVAFRVDEALVLRRSRARDRGSRACSCRT